MQVNKLTDGILHVKCDTQYELTSTFLRLQEFYESPFEGIKGCYFDLEEYMDCYAADQGNFTYTTDWCGFNVPLSVIKDFKERFEGKLLRKEKVLLDNIELAGEGMNDYYVIGTYGDRSLKTLYHEISHGMFYLNTEYQESATKILKKFSSEDRLSMSDYLTGRGGYCAEVIIDEAIAYLSTSSMTGIASRFGKDINWNLVLEIKKNFEDFVDELGLEL